MVAFDNKTPPEVAATGYRRTDVSITSVDANQNGISAISTIDTGALANMFNDIGGKVAETVRRIQNETTNRPLADAAQVLHTALAHHGIYCPDDWCSAALDTLRRGEPLVIDMH